MSINGTDLSTQDRLAALREKIVIGRDTLATRWNNYTGEDAQARSQGAKLMEQFQSLDLSNISLGGVSLSDTAYNATSLPAAAKGKIAAKL